MAIAGALIGGAIGAFGEKPKVPELPTINPDLIQQQTVAGNIANFGDISKLATSVNQFNQQQLNALLDQALPGARQQIEKNISSQLRGEIPSDVSQAVLNSGASRAVAGGFSGSGFGKNLQAKDLGLTSLGIMNNALSSAESWLQRATAPQMDVTAMFFSPQQRLAFAQTERNAQFQRDLMAAQVKAAPDPATAALGQEIDRFFNTAASVGMMAAGQAMGGGGAGGAMGSSGGGGGMFGGVGNGGGNMQAAGMGGFGGNYSSMMSQFGGGGGNYGGGGGQLGTAGGQGLPGIGQSNLNGAALWSREFGSMY